MKVLLMNPIHNPMEMECCDIGLGYLASGLLRSGHEVKLLLRSLCEDKFRDILISEKPDIVGIKVLTANVNAVVKTIKTIREAGSSIIAIGGPHVSGDPLGVLEYISADYALSSEADLSFVEFTNLMAKDALKDRRKFLPGLIYRENGLIKANPSEVITDISALPFPAWELMPPGNYPSLAFKRSPVAGIMVTRGCSNICSFCAESHKRLRFRRVENVLAEIKYLIDRFNVREIQFLDSNFIANKAYVKALCNAILESKISAAFCAPNGGRLENIDDEICDLLVRIGFYRINTGIESGSPEILSMIQKDSNLSLVKEKVKLLHKHGIHVIGNFMVGFPGETRRQMQKTLDLALSLDLTAVNFFIYTPMPGTKLYADLIGKRKLFHSRDFKNYNFVAYENNLSEMSPKELKKFRTKCLFAFVIRWRIFKIAAELIKSGISWSSIARRIYWMYISKLV